MNDTTPRRRKVTAAEKKMRAYTHLFEPSVNNDRYCSDKCNCGLSESNPIHDFRDPPGVGAI